MDYAAEIAKAGFGYLLFVGALPIIFWQNKKIDTLQDKRVDDIAQSREVFTSTAKDLLNALTNIQKTIDTIVVVMDSIKNGKH